MLVVNDSQAANCQSNNRVSDEIAVVVLVYQGKAFLSELCQRLVTALSTITDGFSVILVDDRSADNAWLLIEVLGHKDPRIRGIQLSRSFGQRHALTASIDHARACWYVVMDCDLQEAPEDIPLLYQKASEGFDVVVGVRSKEGHSTTKRLSSRLFYTVFNLASGIDLDWSVGNFRAFSDRVAAGFREIREQLRFFPASLNWMGFEVGSIVLPYHNRPSGKSSYTYRKLLRLAGITILAHSQVPLKFTALVGLVIAALSIVAGMTIVARVLIWGASVTGWASSDRCRIYDRRRPDFPYWVVGLYVGKCFEEAKRRPLFFARATSNL